jgi:RNA polymerase sigma-70 factor (ECF subfamily)
VQRDLVVRAQSGDADAFSILASQSVDRLHGVAYRILRDADRADDATQQSLIAAWKHIRGLRDPDSFDAWTYRMVVHAAYREARRERSRQERIRWILPNTPSEPDVSSAAAQRDELERAFRKLSPEHRAVLVLRHYADLPLAEIAQILRVPVGTVGSRIFHATRQLRAALESSAAPVVPHRQAV